ncbi:hypothetical protein [Pararhizobium sp. IMCC21322]|uniref:hypothetical protein n=1 Tax=Pararhizobium sp. IMCC21322 TaxID=3067903 RepID=UPI0027419461|nr:hypothetical protein [Pararhizobium sp. IMCC21322]
MTSISVALQANYAAFSEQLPIDLQINAGVFRGKKSLVESYARIASLNALKIDLIEPNFPKGAAQFFFEAHNDALLSHVNACFGSWRPALQSLRSFMENSLAAIYYLDHPVEFSKWEKDTFRITPKELREYASCHPKALDICNELGLKVALDTEYATLSKAVHGSNSLFRMTSANGKTNIAQASIPELGKWSARERATVDICVTLMIAVLHEHLDGAKMSGLRTSLSVSLRQNSRKALKEHLGITIPNP